MATKRSLADCRLYTFVDTGYLGDRSAIELTRQLCDGGSDVIQLRAKGYAPDQVLALAESMAPIAENAGVHLVINDHPSIAARLPTPFVHLGQEDFFDAGWQSKADLPKTDPPMTLGLSTHAPDQCERALATAADYVAIGPIFATPTKPSAKPVTLEYVTWAAEHVDRPWFAIGGVNRHTLPAVIAAGATRVCVVSDILNADHPDRACQAIRDQLPS